MTSDAHFAPGTVFENYQILSLLGEGGMGAVWKALHLKLKKPVAIKTLKGDHAKSEQARKRFLREGEAASRIRHLHVVEIYDVGTVGDNCYLVMEFLEGEALAARLQRDRALPLAALADIMVPVCAAVTAAHEEGVVHRDLKPDNIFLVRTRDGWVHPKVLDFGISRIQGEEGGQVHTATSALLGTPRYMAPEQARGNNREVTERCDQYALGVMLYQGATGVLPIDEMTLYAQLTRVVHGSFSPPRAARPDLPADFERIILRAMANRAEDRFPSVRNLGAALLPYASERTRVLFHELFRGVISAPPSVSLPLPPVSNATLGGSAREVTTVDRAGAPTRWRYFMLLASIGAAVFALSLGVASRFNQQAHVTTVTVAPPSRFPPVAALPPAPTPAVARPGLTPRAVTAATVRAPASAPTAPVQPPTSASTAPPAVRSAASAAPLAPVSTPPRARTRRAATSRTPGREGLPGIASPTPSRPVAPVVRRPTFSDVD